MLKPLAGVVSDETGEKPAIVVYMQYALSFMLPPSSIAEHDHRRLLLGALSSQRISHSGRSAKLLATRKRFNAQQLLSRPVSPKQHSLVPT